MLPTSNSTVGYNTLSAYYSIAAFSRPFPNLKQQFQDILLVLLFDKETEAQGIELIFPQNP